MQKIFQFIILLQVILLVGCSKFLDEHPKSFLTPENFYRTPEDLNGGLNTVYRYPQDRYSNGWAAPHWFEWGTDEQEITDKSTWAMHNQIARLNATFDATADVPVWMWEYTFNHLKDANYLLQALENVNLEQSKKTEIEGQTKALRALMLFDAVRIWNGVPLILEASSDIDPLRTIKRASPEEMYAAIISDLVFAKDNLPAQWSGAANAGRITSGSAAALLAKVYLTMAGYPLNQKDRLQDAKTVLNDLIVQKKYGSGFALVPEYADIYNQQKQPHSEAVWTINFTRGTFGQGSDFHTNYAPLELYYASGIGLARGGGWSNGIPTEKFYDSYDKVNDKRFKATYWTSTADIPAEYNSLVPQENGVPKHIEFYRPHIKKFREPIPNDNSQRTGIDHYIIRYADVLLMYAEVLNELDDNNKYTYINQVRQRAGLAPLANMSQQAFREHMYLERGWELAHEGDRRFDLVRWGVYITRTPQWNPQVVGNIQADKHEFWPIPQGQIDINRNLTQNDGY